MERNVSGGNKTEAAEESANFIMLTTEADAMAFESAEISDAVHCAQIAKFKYGTKVRVGPRMARPLPRRAHCPGKGAKATYRKPGSMKPQRFPWQDEERRRRLDAVSLVQHLVSDIPALTRDTGDVVAPTADLEAFSPPHHLRSAPRQGRYCRRRRASPMIASSLLTCPNSPHG